MARKRPNPPELVELQKTRSLPTAAIADGRQGARIRVRVIPRSRREEIAPVHGDEIRVRLTEVPAEGQANKALVKLLARVLKVRSRDVEITSGASSRRKTVRVRGLGAGEAQRRLAGWISGNRLA